MRLEAIYLPFLNHKNTLKLVCAEKSPITLIHTVKESKCKHATSILTQFKRVVNVPLPSRVFIIRCIILDNQLDRHKSTEHCIKYKVKNNKIKQ